MDAQNFDFALKYIPKLRFSSPKFCIFGRKHLEKKKICRQFFDSTKFCGGNCLPCLPPYNDPTDDNVNNVLIRLHLKQQLLAHKIHVQALSEQTHMTKSICRFSIYQNITGNEVQTRHSKCENKKKHQDADINQETENRDNKQK